MGLYWNASGFPDFFDNPLWSFTGHTIAIAIRSLVVDGRQQIGDSPRGRVRLKNSQQVKSPTD